MGRRRTRVLARRSQVRAVPALSSLSLPACLPGRRPWISFHCTAATSRARRSVAKSASLSCRAAASWALVAAHHALPRFTPCLAAAENPVRWVRLDPAGELLCDIRLLQPERMLAAQLLHSRDVVAQAEAIQVCGAVCGDACAAILRPPLRAWRCTTRSGLSWFYSEQPRLFGMFTRCMQSPRDGVYGSGMYGSVMCDEPPHTCGPSAPLPRPALQRLAELRLTAEGGRLPVGLEALRKTLADRTVFYRWGLHSPPAAAGQGPRWREGGQPAVQCCCAPHPAQG